MAPAYDAADDDELIGEDPFEEPAAKRIKECVLNIQRDASGEETAPVQLAALLEMVAGAGLSTNETIVAAAQEVLRLLDEVAT